MASAVVAGLERLTGSLRVPGGVLPSAALGALLMIAIAAPLAVALNVWLDEAFALHSTGAGVAYAWHEAIAFEAQPPLFFVLEAAWRTLNEDSIGFARLPSIVFAAAAVAVIVGAAGRLAPRVPAPLVALITAVNPIVIWAATEIRVYALVVLVGAVLSWTFFCGFLANERSRGAQRCYTAFAIIGLYTQYYIGFVLLAHALTLLLVRRRSLRAFAFAMAVVTAAFLPFAPTAFVHVTGTGGYVTHPSLYFVIHEIFVNVFVYALPHDFSWSGAVKIVSAFASFAAIAIVGFNRPVITERATRAVIVGWAMSIAIFIVLFVTAGLPSSVRRHIIVVAPSTMLVALMLVSSLTRRRLIAERIILATFAASTAATLYLQYQPPLMKTGDWQRIARTLVASDAAPIAVFPAEITLPLGTYLKRPLIAIPRPMAFTYDYIHTMALTSEADVARTLDPIRARSERLWLVTGDDACMGDNAGLYVYHCEFLQLYLDRRYRLLKTISSGGTLVQLYTRAGPPTP